MAGPVVSPEALLDELPRPRARTTLALDAAALAGVLVAGMGLARDVAPAAQAAIFAASFVWIAARLVGQTRRRRARGR